MTTLSPRSSYLPAGVMLIAPLIAGLVLTLVLSRSGVASRLFDHTTPGTAPAPQFDARTPAAQGTKCGIERWPVKTLSDDDASQVNFNPVRTTVRKLLRLTRPDSLPTETYRHRIAPIELTTYVIQAVAIELRPDSDNDTHLIIADPEDLTSTMVTEFVYWNCAGAIDSKQKTTFKTAFEQLHYLFGDRYSPTLIADGQTFMLADWYGPTRFEQRTGQAISAPRTGVPPPELIKSALIEIVGVGFFDSLDDATKGAAPNGIQLHPVLSVRKIP